MYRLSRNCIARLTFGIALCGYHWIPAQAQERWYGTYIAESTGMNVTQTRSWVIEESLEVSRSGDKIVAVYSVAMNGDPLNLSERWIGHDFGSSIAFTFDRCLPPPNDQSDALRQKPKKGDCTDQYRYRHGDPMLTIVDKSGPTNQKILLTKFQKFVPSGDDVNAEGEEYFRKILLK